MKPLDHYDEAEWLLKAAADATSAVRRDQLLAAAQIHATLALAPPKYDSTLRADQRIGE